MKKIDLIFLILMMLIFFPLSSCLGKSYSDRSREDDIPLKPPTIEVMNPVIEGFTKGINLGNGLDAPQEGDWGVTLTEKHFSLAASSGLDHVRLPVRFNAHALITAPFTIDESFLLRVDWAIDTAEKYGLSVLLDFHHYEEIMDHPEAHRARYLAIWEQLALRYKDRPQNLAFELLNEPCKKMVPEILNPLMEETFIMIRRSNPSRLLVIGCPDWSHPITLAQIDTSYMDGNTAVTFHMYNPVLFSVQQSPWMGPLWSTGPVYFPGPPEQPLKVSPAASHDDWVVKWFRDYNNLPPNQNPSGLKTIYESFDYATEFVKKTGVRVYCGEFGCVDFADGQSRHNYIEAVRKESERRGVGWCIWDDGGHNKCFSPKEGRWIESVRTALFEG